MERLFLLTLIQISGILCQMNNTEINDILSKCISLKPRELIISDLKWKYLIRAVLRSKNVMIIGPTGCAKTFATHCIAKALNRPFEKFNIGSTDDARATLIGNTTYKKEIGTIFHKSTFVNAITTPNTIVLLDELTRGTHAAWNILFPVLDPLQRYLRLDENESGETIKVADGVCFIATANIGTEYTSTRVLDKALARRFPVKLEMPLLTEDELKHLFGILFPDATPDQKKLMKTLASISDDLIAQCQLEDAKITSVISPANIIEMCYLILDGFNLEEIAEAAIYPDYPDESGADSERVFVRSVCQKYFPKNVKSPIHDPLVNRNKADF